VHTTLQLMLDGLAMGMVYVFMASGFNLIMSVPRILFIAFGQFYVLGAFITWYVTIPGGQNFFLGVLAGTLAAGGLGAVVYLLVFRKIQFSESQFLTNIIAGFGLMMILGQVALMLFGTETRGIPSRFPGIIHVAGVSVSRDKVVVIAISVLIIVLLHVFLQKTRMGRAMRAVSFNMDVASLMGVNSDRMFLLAVAVGCALAGLAGGLMAPIFAVSTAAAQGGLLVLLVVMLGGVGSMIGAILGGLVFGMTLSYGQYYIGSGQAQIAFFAVIAVVLLFRPGGILGKAQDDIPV
jgi:branched-chain amino acid transport system permease protein